MKEHRFSLMRPLLRLATLALTIVSSHADVRAESYTSPNDSLLYNPALDIVEGAESVNFRGERYSYTFLPGSGEWRVRQEDNTERLIMPREDPYVYRGPEGTWCLDGMVEGRKGVLRCWRGADTLSSPVWRQTLWDARIFEERYHARPGMPKGTEPEVTGVAGLNGLLWVSVGFYGGEEFDGVGTLVRFDPSGRLPVKIVQPDTLRNSYLGPITAADGALWIGSSYSGEFRTYKNLGLVRFVPSDSSLTIWPPSMDPLGGDVVTALLGTEDNLWFATDAGMGRMRLGDRRWERWRIVPFLHLNEATPVHSHPKLPPRGHLPAGEYEVRWVDNRDNEGWAELVTPGLAAGWIRKLQMLGEDCQVAPVILTTWEWPEPSDVELSSSPGKAPSALLVRVRQHPTGSSYEGEGDLGWIELRANAGWIAPGERQIRMKIVRDRGATEALQQDGMPSEIPE